MYTEKFKSYFRFFVLALVCFISIRYIFFGSQGICRYLRLNKEIKIQERKVLKLEKKIKNLTSEIEAWLEDDFELEKMARKDLQMSLSSEKLIYIPVL